MVVRFRFIGGSCYFECCGWDLIDPFSDPFSDPFEDSNTGGQSFITVRMKYVFAFQFWYFEPYVENQW